MKIIDCIMKAHSIGDVVGVKLFEGETDLIDITTYTTIKNAKKELNRELTENEYIIFVYKNFEIKITNKVL